MSDIKLCTTPKTEAVKANESYATHITTTAPTFSTLTPSPRMSAAVPTSRRTGGATTVLPTHPSETAYPTDYADAP